MERRTRQKRYTLQTCINLFSATSIRNIFQCGIFRVTLKTHINARRLGLHEKCQFTAVRLLPKLGRLDAFLIKLSCNKFHTNPCSSSRVFKYGHMGGQTDIPKVIEAFHNIFFPNAPTTLSSIVRA